MSTVVLVATELCFCLVRVLVVDGRCVEAANGRPHSCGDRPRRSWRQAL